MLDLLDDFGKIYSSSYSQVIHKIFRKGLSAMKRSSYNHDAHMMAKLSSRTTEADYARAMKTYKLFATASGVILTVAYVALQIL